MEPGAGTGLRERLHAGLLPVAARPAHQRHADRLRHPLRRVEDDDPAERERLPLRFLGRWLLPAARARAEWPQRRFDPVRFETTPQTGNFYQLSTSCSTSDPLMSCKSDSPIYGASLMIPEPASALLLGAGLGLLALRQQRRIKVR
jgi:hypothetical protein